jgi:hypothetical protein
MNAIAEHFRHHLASAKEMHLEAVRLFLCTRFGVDTPDVFF